VVLVRVVELDADIAVSVLLTKEGASMREQLFVLSPGARDNYLTELVGRDNIFSDELLQRFINFVAFILDLSHNREYFAVLDEEVSKSCIRNALVDLSPVQLFVSFLRCVLPESHDLLSGDEEVMAHKLVDVENEAVVLHSGIKVDLLSGDQIIRDH